MSTYDLLIREAYVPERDSVVDVGIEDGDIAAVEESLSGGATVVVGAGGNLLSPGLVDAHKHVDRALSATGERRPLFNDEPNASPAAVTEQFDEYYEATPLVELTARAAENLAMVVEAGTTHVRTHVAVDHSVGTDTMRAVLRATDRLADAVSVQVVPYAIRGLDDPRSRDLVDEAVEMARERLDTPVILGGSIGLIGGEPAPNYDRTIAEWFAFATERDLDLDVHVTSRGAAGYYALDRLAAATVDHGYEGRVTAVHAYGLAGLPDWWLDPLLDRLAAAGIGVTTCYNSLRESMPIRELAASDVTLAHGTDNDRDFVYPHGNADSVEAARTMSYKLIDDWHFPPDYRWSETNPALATLWETITTGAAATLGLDGYGIEEGTPADLVLFDEPSPEWTILSGPAPRLVVKDGQIVVRDGDRCWTDAGE